MVKFWKKWPFLQVGLSLVVLTIFSSEKQLLTLLLNFNHDAEKSIIIENQGNKNSKSTIFHNQQENQHVTPTSNTATAALQQNDANHHIPTTSQNLTNTSWTMKVQVVPTNDNKQSSMTIVHETSSISAICRPTWGSHNDPCKIRRLFFAHTRKAGGSFLRHMFQDVAKLHNWTFKAVEGAAVERERRDDTLYVTNLRHPVDRVISHYKYEGRWDCGQMIKHQKKGNFTMENSDSLEHFMSLHSYEANKQRCSRFPQLWLCSELCYLRWFGEDFNCLKNVSRSFDTAMKKLSHQFHLVVITEWLKVPEYHAALLRMFGIDTQRKYSTTMYCDPESKYWNKQFPAILQNETLKHLHRMNELDLKLYDQLTNCPGGSVVFPPPLLPPP